MYSSSIPIVNCVKFWPIPIKTTNNIKILQKPRQKNALQFGGHSYGSILDPSFVPLKLET
jgi:hypothetical protein